LAEGGELSHALGEITLGTRSPRRSCTRAKPLLRSSRIWTSTTRPRTSSDRLRLPRWRAIEPPGRHTVWRITSRSTVRGDAWWSPRSATWTRSWRSVEHGSSRSASCTSTGWTIAYWH